MGTALVPQTANMFRFAICTAAALAAPTPPPARSMWSVYDWGATDGGHPGPGGHTHSCGVDSALSSMSKVWNTTDGTEDRCFVTVTPESEQPLPVVIWFHGAGGSASDCGVGGDAIDMDGVTL